MKRVIWLCVLLASCAGGERSSGERADTAATESLRSDPRAGWSAHETGGQGKPARWSVVKGPGGEAVFKVESDNAEQVYNLWLSDAAHGPDIALSTRLHADAGFEDMGGGLVWRAKDASNYYVTRWNPLESNLRAYFVRDGARKQLASTTVELDPAAWHELSVRMVGPQLTIAVDGVERLALEDATFAEAGRIGLWTKADASTSFSVPKVETLAR